MSCGLDEVEDGDDNGGVAGGVVEDVGDVVFEALFEVFEGAFVADVVVGSASEVEADFADELLAFVNVNEGAGDDVGDFEEAAGFSGNG